MNNNTTDATAQAPTAASRATEFVPVEGGGQTTDAATYLVAAYVLMWVCTLVFILQTWRKTRRVQLQVDSLQKAMAKTS